MFGGGLIERNLLAELKLLLSAKKYIYFKVVYRNVSLLKDKDFDSLHNVEFSKYVLLFL